MAKSILKNWEIKEDDENESVKESKEENLSFNSEKNNSDEEKKILMKKKKILYQIQKMNMKNQKNIIQKVILFQ